MENILTKFSFHDDVDIVTCCIVIQTDELGAKFTEHSASTRHISKLLIVFELSLRARMRRFEALKVKAVYTLIIREHIEPLRLHAKNKDTTRTFSALDENSHKQ